MVGLKSYRRKGGDIRATQMDQSFTASDGKGAQKEFAKGDYLVLTVDGDLEGAVQADFEAQFELVKKNYNKPKPKKAVAGTAPAAAEAKAS